jgi:hypothetical protein
MSQPRITESRSGPSSEECRGDGDLGKLHHNVQADPAPSGRPLCRAGARSDTRSDWDQRFGSSALNQDPFRIAATRSASARQAVRTDERL